MATVFDVGIVTDVGKELLQKVQNHETTMQFFKFAIGSGTWQRSQMAAATALKSPRNNYDIASSEKVGTNLKLKTILANAIDGASVVATRYDMTELGLYAKDGNNNEILYGLAICTGEPEEMEAYTGDNLMQVEQEWLAVIGDAEIDIDYSGAYALAEDLEAEVQARKEADLIQKYDLVNKTTNIGIVDGNKHVLETYTDSGDTVDITIVKTSDTVKTVTTVVTPAEGNYKYTKTETITTTSSGKNIVANTVRSEKGEN